MRNIAWLDNSVYDEFYEDEEEELEDDEDDEESNIKKSLLNKISKLPMILNTPFGTYRSDDSLNPYSNRQVWLAHTNFPLVVDMDKKIENVAGVDGLRILSPYSFIIIVGFLFDSDDVRYNIEKALDVEIIEEDSLDDTSYMEQKYIDNLNKETKVVSSASKYWMLYLFPNGEITSLACKDKEEWQEKINMFQIMKRLSFGKLITSETEKAIETNK